MPSLGEKLRSERETRGIPLDKIAAETRISLRFLDALEKGDIEHLPGGAFNKGFVRSYASYLGLEPEPYVREYEEEEHTATEVGRLPERRDVLDELRETLGRGEPKFGDEAVRRILRVAVPFVVVAALAALIWWVVLPLASEWSTRQATETAAADSGMLGDAAGEPGSSLLGGSAAAGSEAAATGDAPSGDAAAGDTASGDAASLDLDSKADDLAGAASGSTTDDATAKLAPATDVSTVRGSSESQDALTAGGATTTRSSTPASGTLDDARDAPRDVATRSSQDSTPASTQRTGNDDIADDREAATTDRAAAAGSGTAETLSPGDGSATRPDLAEAAVAAPSRASSDDQAASAPAGTVLTITDWGVGMGVESRELVGRSTGFDEGDTIFFWTRLEGGAPGVEVRHVWLRDGRPVGLVKLPVNGSPWRTHSRFTLPYNAGTSYWSAEARDRNGNVLASQEFSVSR